MQLEPEQRLISPGQRIVPVGPSGDGSGRMVFLALAAAAVLAALGFAFQDRVSAWCYAVEEVTGLAPSQQPFTATYQRLGISALPPRLFAQAKVANSLGRLAQEPCDRPAIGMLANRLAANGEERQAASALMGFSLSCRGSENEQAAAGGLFLKLGDADKALAVANALTSARPEIANFHYFRARALIAAGHGAEAVDEYKSTIDLSPAPRLVSEQVFLELADLYASLDRPCEAVQTILNWVTIDPATRNTVREHKLVETYAARGCAAAAPRRDSSTL